MSLKKKSVLGLSYLTVALLGASVLMTNPVSADVSDVTTGLIEVGEVNEQGLEVRLEPKELSDFEKAWASGWEDGYQQGLKSDASGPEIEIHDIPYSEYHDGEYSSDYNDGYRVGFATAWTKSREEPQTQDDQTVEATNEQDLSKDGAVITTGNGFGIMSTIASIIEWFYSWF